MDTISVAVAIPVYGDPNSLFSQSLTNMICHFYETKLVGPDGQELKKRLECFFVSSSMLTESRHRLVAEALNWGADYLLWADADHVFPANALNRLLVHNLDIVGCNYARRADVTAPTAARMRGETDRENLIYTTEAKAMAGEIEEVDHLGFGLCLMRMACFDALQVKAEADGKKSFMPLFTFKPNETGTGMVGEDVYFFAKCRDAGLKVYVDHGLSWEVGHVFRRILTNAHAVAQVEQWEAENKAAHQKLEDRACQLEAAE